MAAISYFKDKMLLSEEHENTTKSNFLNFPVEIASHVFSFLPLNDMIACLKVCKLWNFILENKKDAWKQYTDKYYFNSKEDLVKKISNNKLSEQDSFEKIYNAVYKSFSGTQFEMFKKQFYTAFDKTPAKKIAYYNYVIDKVKLDKSEMTALYNIEKVLSQNEDIRTVKEKLIILKTSTQKEIYTYLSQMDGREFLKEEIRNYTEILNNNFENSAIKFIQIYIKDPVIVCYLNTINFSGFKTQSGMQRDALEELIKLAFLDQGAGFYSTLKEIERSKGKHTNFIEIFEIALNDYSSGKKNPTKKRRVPASE